MNRIIFRGRRDYDRWLLSGGPEDDEGQDVPELEPEEPDDGDYGDSELPF